MKKTILSLLFAGILFSQEAQITNIQAAQRTDGSQIVDIYYDLLPDQFFHVFTIAVEIGLGNSFITLTELSGDVGAGITSGDGKHIVWDAGNHPVFDDVFFDNLIVKITGESVIVDELPFEMVMVEAGSFDNCGTEDEISYAYSIMESPVTFGQYAEFLIHKLNAGEMIVQNAEDSQIPSAAYYSGDNRYPPGIYEILSFMYGYAISWNGTTFIVEEGRGDEAVSYTGGVGARMFAEHYSLRLPTLDERRKNGELLTLGYVSISNEDPSPLNEYIDSADYGAISGNDICDTILLNNYIEQGNIQSSFLYTFRCVANQ